MNFLRKHWYDLGGLFALCIIVWLLCAGARTSYSYIVWLSLLSLLLHQLEEYRIVGTFPGMVNRVMYKSDQPDRYPLNTNTAFWVNVGVGWTTYLLAAVLGEGAVWLGMATMLVSVGNIVAHTLVFNLKGKTFYNAGLATSWLCFAPCVYFFFQTAYGLGDYLIGVPLGIVLNGVGVLKMIDWLADRNTTFIFEQRQLLSADRRRKHEP